MPVTNRDLLLGGLKKVVMMPLATAYTLYVDISHHFLISLHRQCCWLLYSSSYICQVFLIFKFSSVWCIWYGICIAAVDGVMRQYANVGVNTYMITAAIALLFSRL